LSLLSFLVLVVMGGFVFAQRFRSMLNRSFGLMCLLMSAWAFSEFMLRSVDSYASAELWAKVRAAAWAPPIAWMFYFVLLFTRKGPGGRRVFVILAVFGPALAFTLIDIATPIISATPVRDAWGYSHGIPSGSWLYWIANAWGTGLGIASDALCFVCAFTAPDPLKRLQARSLAVGFLIPIVAAVATEVVLPALGTRVPQLTSITASVLGVFIARAIRKYEMFVINPAMAAEKILSTISESVVLLDENDTILSVNAASLTLSGRKEGELLGRPAEPVFEGIRERLADTRRLGAVRDADLSVIRPDGTRVPVLFSATLMKRPKGDRAGIVAVSTDISARREAETAREKLIDELSHALANIKTLQGLIPICSSCKKIRNDKGYWQQLEEYMAQHSSVAFSHSLCDECIQKLYPELAEKILKKLK
jgi:PAS domain S-box-containing protein